MNNTATADYRRRAGIAMTAAGLLVMMAGCAVAAPHHAAGFRTPATKATRIVVTSQTRAAGSPATAASTSGSEPHFRTPRAAMTYLAAAYNRDDAAALHEVTTPASFRELKSMRSGAIDLRLKSCKATGRGDYVCTFTHRYPHASGHGESVMVAAPALDPGWYMYQLADCG